MYMTLIRTTVDVFGAHYFFEMSNIPLCISMSFATISTIFAMGVRPRFHVRPRSECMVSDEGPRLHPITYAHTHHTGTNTHVHNVVCICTHTHSNTLTYNTHTHVSTTHAYRHAHTHTHTHTHTRIHTQIQTHTMVSLCF